MKYGPGYDRLVEKHGREKARAMLKLQKTVIKKQFPTMLWSPNRGQKNLLEVLDRDHLPFVGAILAGNGVGKTNLLTVILAGIAFGPKYIPPKYRYDFFDLKIKRIRLLCDGTDVAPGGSLYDEMVEWFPKDRYKFHMDGKQIGHIEIFNRNVEIQIRTFSQMLVSHEGSNLDLVLVNEPPPQDKYGAAVARLRKGIPGMIMLFATPLNIAAWLYDQLIEDEDDYDKVVVYASIWDNCKDIPGTNGVLSKEKIESQIREWKKSDPDEAYARETGQFRHLAGRIYKNFNDNVHLIDPSEVTPVSRNWPVYCIIDPHATKPPAVVWIAQSPMNKFYVVAEYPTGVYTTLNGETKKVEGYVEDINDIERETFGPDQVMWRYMDPNKGRTNEMSKDLTVQQLYEEAGLFFDTEVTDDLEVGHKKVNSLLFYDKDREVDETNRPAFYISRACRNTVAAIRKYAWKSKTKGKGEAESLTSKVDPKYKDFADVIRYFSVKQQDYVSPEVISGEAKNFYKARDRR